MNIGLVTLNARFVHVALALRYLRNAARRAGFDPVWIAEYTIDQPLWKISADIQRRKPDVLGIGVYIWNRTQSFQLIEMLRKQNPGLSIVVGGPEVSFEPELSPDYTVIGGEGESKWVEYLEYRRKGETPAPDVLERWKTYGNDAPELLPPYIEEDYAGLAQRMAYLETSRGCPYLCSFCLSALDKTVRYFDDAAVRKQIEDLAAAGVKTVKFIDRTFNLKGRRMIDLMRWLDRFESVAFHFEVVGDLLTDDLLDFLEGVRPGQFQFEIGIQTTGEAGQQAIERRQDNGKLFHSIRRLVRSGRIHLHCDLIFGLPGETLDDCFLSFAEVFSLQPHELQTGFLKFLPGAPIRKLIESHGYRFQSFPPYEIISHDGLDAGSVLRLKKFSETVDRFYNSKRFHFSILRLLETRTPVELFTQLSGFLEDRGLLYAPMSLDNQMRAFHEAFHLAGDPAGEDILRLDYLYHQEVYRLPPFLRGPDKGRLKTFSGDGRTPLFPFAHEIQVRDGKAVLQPVPEPVYYAFIHSRGGRSGYISEPVMERETVA